MTALSRLLVVSPGVTHPATQGNSARIQALGQQTDMKPAMNQFQRFTQRAEEDRVLADAIAGAQGVDADFRLGPGPDQPFSAVA